MRYGARTVTRVALATLATTVALVMIVGAIVPTPSSGSASPRTYIGVGHGNAATLASVGTLDSANTTGLTLGITAQPSAICANQDNACPAGVGTARVTLTADAGGTGTVSWPRVQVAFVVETTDYDGVYDPTAGEPGSDPCASGSSTNVLCEESNGVPFFVANAQSIANAISVSNPHTTVSFAMVDYFATLTDWDDGDGAEYHVDLPQFVPANEFGTDVQSSFKQTVLSGHLYYSDSDNADNMLHSSSITALFGTIIGSGLNWANDTHHVIVWMGSTAPRDPAYPVNYCISNSVFTSASFPSCVGSTCEPSYRFPTIASPACEGWVKSQDGNATHSIAGLSKTAKQCTQSIGGTCTIDTVDYWDTPTDPYSKGWATGKSTPGGGPGGTLTIQNSAHIIAAGCDLAAATGGNWAGPAWASCPNGQTGTLQYVEHGSYSSPNTQNPTLFAALKQIGFGPVVNTQVAAGTGHPIFTFLPIGNIALAPTISATAQCTRGGSPFTHCQAQPTVLHQSGLTYLGWNWSTNASGNIMYVGDSWTASFNIVATGPPYSLVPVDACTTIDCKAAGSSSIFGLYTWASYVPASNNSIVTQSFPLGQIRVEIAPAPAIGNTPPPPPPPPPPFAIPTAPPLPVIQQVGIGNTVGIANVSLQAVAAGFLGAGFMRVGMKNRPIAMKVAAKSGTFRSAFDGGMSKGDAGVGRFE